MPSNHSIYDHLYQEARSHGWQGWGGDDRIAKGPQQLQTILTPLYVPRSGRVLELGCGEGHLSRLLAAHGFDVIGADISAVAIRWAREKTLLSSGLHFIQADLSQPDVLKGMAFNLVVDGNCLHCVLPEDRQVFLHNIHRLLAENGVFFVSSLCSRSDTAIVTYLDGAPYRYIPTPSELLNELLAANFHVCDSDVHEGGEFNHINVFLKKFSDTPHRPAVSERTL